MNYVRRFKDRENAIPMEMEMNRRVFGKHTRTSFRPCYAIIQVSIIRDIYRDHFPLKIRFVLFVGGFSMKTADGRSWYLIAQCGSPHAER